MATKRITTFSADSGITVTANYDRWIDRALPDKNDQREYAGEWTRERVAERIAAEMERLEVSRAELARRLDTSRSAVTRMLTAQNLTLKKVGEILHALDLELADLDLRPFGSRQVWTDLPWLRWSNLEAANYQSWMELGIQNIGVINGDSDPQGEVENAVTKRHLKLVA